VRNYNAKLKVIFFLALSALFISGCVNSIDLGKQAHEQRSISSMQSAVDLKNGNDQVTESQIGNINPVKILFVGDIMFDRYIREGVNKYGNGDYGYILDPVKEKLSEYDLVVGNLEGPITDKESVSVNTKMDEKKNLVFTFDPVVAKTLFENNIKLVNLGNNHILNQGANGIEQTKKFLSDAGVEYFGDTGSELLRDLVPKNINGIKISFVSYNYSVSESVDAAIEEIKSAKEKSDIVIVLPHWGTEYKVGDPGEAVRALAHRFIDAGADAIIGTHPHVVQTSEEYKGKKIYYSLGNFVFDQYFQKETMEGLGVEMTINADRKMEFGELKFEMTKRGQTILKAKP
jgi:poly-gamma-glutamate capsule biosynthesis protein CapA/YwtB (metallophosphatase superfamily)